MRSLWISLAAIAIATSAQAQQWPQARQVPTSRTGVIPPIEYDYPYRGVLVLQRADKEKLERECPIQTPMTMACAFQQKGTPAGEASPYCRIVIANDEVLEERQRTRGFWTYDIILRHEMGHCNGWGGDHSGGRSLMEAEADDRIRKRDEYSTKLYKEVYLLVRGAWLGLGPQRGMKYRDPWAGWRHMQRTTAFQW